MIGRGGGEGDERLLVTGLVADRIEDGCHVDLGDDHVDRLAVIERAVADAHVEGVGAGALGLGRGPAEVAAGGDRGTGRSADKAEGQDLDGDVVIGRGGGEGDERLLVTGLVADRIEDGCHVDLGDDHVDRLAVIERAVADAHVEGVGAGARASSGASRSRRRR